MTMPADTENPLYPADFYDEPTAADLVARLIADEKRAPLPQSLSVSMIVISG